MKITRLLAVQRCGTNNSCPAVLELADGDFIVIGKITDWIEESLAGYGDVCVAADETAVVVPRDVLLSAARQATARETPLTSEEQERVDKELRTHAESTLAGTDVALKDLP